MNSDKTIHLFYLIIFAKFVSGLITHLLKKQCIKIT